MSLTLEQKRAALKGVDVLDAEQIFDAVVAALSQPKADQPAAPAVEPVAYTIEDKNGVKIVRLAEHVEPRRLIAVKVTPLYAAPPAPVAIPTVSLSRDEFHDKAWALYHAKTFDDTQLAKVNIHTIRVVFNAVFDAGRFSGK